MIQETFIKIDGITGESKQAEHKGWIDVLDFGYRVSQPAALSTGGGGGVGRADFPPLVFSHYIDRASPGLFKYCAAGKHIPKVVLSACKAGGKSKEFLNIELSEVIVADVSPSGSSGAQAIERVSLSYANITIKIKEQNADGSLGAEVTGGWHIKENKEC